MRWWEENVAGRGNPAIGTERPISAARGLLGKDEAEAGTGIQHQQVSRWRKSLRDPKKYRDNLIIAAYRKAGLEPDPEKGGRGKRSRISESLADNKATAVQSLVTMD